jgi:hypothetical protein
MFGNIVNVKLNRNGTGIKEMLSVCIFLGTLTTMKMVYTL